MKKETGNIAIELSLIVFAVFFLFAASWHASRYFYWQQHFDYAADRWVKLLAMNVQASKSLDTADLDDALTLLASVSRHVEFKIGLKAYLLSDDLSKEVSMNVGENCHVDDGKFPESIEELPDITQSIPDRYMLRLSLCAEPQEWVSYLPDYPFINELKPPFTSHTFYPINHQAFE